MSRRSIIFLVGVLLIGCATSGPPRVGSEEWYKARLAEIEAAYANKEIDKAKYLELKNETDALRADYLNDWDTYSRFGYGHRHGSRVGVGVDVGF